MERVDRPVQDHPIPAGDPQRHHGRLGQGRAAVVEGGVGGFQAGQTADDGLVLEERLQGPLGAFGLVGGIGGVELGTAGQVVHRRGDYVVVVTAADKRNDAAVPRRHLVQPGQHLELRHSGREVEGSGPQRFRDRVEQVADAPGADGGKHLPDLFRGMRRETHLRALSDTRRIVPCSSASPPRKGRSSSWSPSMPLPLEIR